MSHHDQSPFDSETDLGDLLTKERLPVGRGNLVEPVLADSPRERILVALAESVARKGYRATTITDVVKSAGVSHETYFELFEDKESCLQAAMELSLADAMGQIVAAYSPDKPWPTMVRDASAALLKLLATRPAFARMAFIEAPAASDRAAELWTSGKRVLLALLDRGREYAIEEAIPPSAGRGAFAAAESLIVGQILTGKTEQLGELLPDIVYVATVPYLGQGEALRHARAARKSASTRT